MPGFQPSPFLLGIEGTRATRGNVALLRETRAAGILLLGRNIESPAQTRGLIAGLQDALGRPLLVSVDHEGGWVLRFSSGLTFFPGNAALGKIGDPGLARRCGSQMARELRALGIGLNLAPVLDVVTERYNPGIIIRSFGRDPRRAGALGAAFIRGHQANGVAACAKHFPGKGAAKVDAHVTLPTISMSRALHAHGHLPPFAAAVKAGVACVMTSHAVFPAWDASRTPATFSTKIIGGLLRERLGFRGTVISDDLCMGAITERMPVAEAAAQALGAGHDLLIVAHGESLQREAVEAAGDAASSPALARLMDRFAGLHPGKAAQTDPALALGIARKAVEMIQSGRVALPLPRRRLAVLWPDFREVRERFTFEGGPEGPLRRLRGAFSRWPAPVEFVKTPVAREGDAARALAAARRADVAVFFCFEALRFPGQKEVLRALQSESPDRLVVCLLRNPWDRSLLKSPVTALHAFGYRECQVDALRERLIS